MQVKDPVIILGPGKSGTTLINHILSLHPNCFWVSSYLNRFPTYHFLGILNNFQRLHFLEIYFRNKKRFPKPAESFNFWNYYISNFHKNPEIYEQDELRNAVKAVNQIRKYQLGNRFIFKITGPSRLKFIDETFKNPYIIWIDRDPKAIIASFFKNKWRYKNRLEEFQNTPRIKLIQEYLDYYLWIDKEKESLKAFKFRKVQYETLVNEPETFFKEICQFTGLEYSTKFRKIVESWKINKNANSKFKDVFSQDEINYINKHLK